MGDGRTLAVGDVHGCAAALDAVLAAAEPRPGDTVVLLGDYIDRGPDSRGVLDRLLRWDANYPGVRLVPLRGNHEIMMLAAGDAAAAPTGAPSLEPVRAWVGVGGDAALASYAPAGRTGRFSDVPAEHWEFLRFALFDYFETGTHFFVHANAYAECPLAEQPPFMLFWESWHGAPPRHESGKRMISGHTPQRSGLPRVTPHAVCIDTGAGFGGPLTCLHVESGRLWRADDAGEVRAGWLDEA